MKKVVKLLFVIVITVTLGNCKKEEPIETNVQAYDLRDPGLYNEQVGEVKWIFCLQYGETKYLDIDGKMYRITLKDVKDNNLGSYYYLEKYKFYADLSINDDTILASSSKSFGYGGYTGEGDLKNDILYIQNHIKELFSSHDLINPFIEEYGAGNAINSFLNIYIPEYKYVSTGIDNIIEEEYRVLFIIIKNTKE